MTKQVPGSTRDIPVPGKEEQLEWLRNRLKGSEVFRMCRGHIGSWPLLHLAEESASPAEFRRRWDQLSRGLREMGSLLTRLKRNGWRYAHDALRRSLSEEILLPGETLEDLETEPVTLVVPKAEAFFAYIEWLARGDWQDLTREGLKCPSPNVQALISGFSDFKMAMEKDSPTSPDREFVSKRIHWLIDFRRRNALSEVVEKLEGFHTVPLLLGSPSANKKTASFLPRMGGAGVLVKADQKEVLRQFSREEQDLLTTWTFDKPKAQELPYYDCGVGLHYEAEHASWRRESPALVSHSTTHGWGAILLIDRSCSESYRPAWDAAPGDPLRIVCRGPHNNIF